MASGPEGSVSVIVTVLILWSTIYYIIMYVGSGLWVLELLLWLGFIV